MLISARRRGEGRYLIAQKRSQKTAMSVEVLCYHGSEELKADLDLVWLV